MKHVNLESPHPHYSDTPEQVMKQTDFTTI